MKNIDPPLDGLTRKKILNIRKKIQDKILCDIQELIGDEVIQVGKTLSTTGKWMGNKVSKIITPTGGQFTCLRESIQDKTLIRVEDLLVTHCELNQNELNQMFGDGHCKCEPQGTIIKDISVSRGNKIVWTKDQKGVWSPDENSVPTDIQIQSENSDHTRVYSVADFTIGPISRFLANEKLGCEIRVMN